jgi:hypothetical protein
MGRFPISVALLNLVFVAGASAQTTKPHASHHPEEAVKPAPPAAGNAPHDCPMMKGEDAGRGMAHDSGQPSPLQKGPAHQMPDGMEHCADMHGPPASGQPSSKP